MTDDDIHVDPPPPVKKAKGIVQCAPEVCSSYRNTLDALEKVLSKLFAYTGSDSGPNRHYLRIK